MQVSLIDYTGHGHTDPARFAANKLVFTKQTRLNMSADQWDRVAAMTGEEIATELEYMANTIPSSWEFVEYTFLINNVTRGFTHQFVRTRVASFAQQTMRVLDVDGWTYGTGPTIPPKLALPGDMTGAEIENQKAYHEAMREIDKVYRFLIDNGAKIEDARGVLPTNIHTNIVAKFNLRTLAETARKRASTRTQGEYRDVLEAMLSAVLSVHPWASLFFNRTFDVSARELEEMINNLYVGVAEFTEENRIKAIKLIDQMRGAA